jgi:hypothetical protein
MSAMTIEIWIETAHHAAFRVGGWAFVRRDGAETSGTAGGARQITAQRNLFQAVLAALKDVPAGAAVILRTSHVIPTEQPEEDADLWTALQAQLAARKVQALRGPANKFAHAWAELARDKAKASGPFASAIPKTNLTKFSA